jgi:hypothetical protein
MWNCSVDDPIFDNINIAQWRWYAHMIANDEEIEFKKNLDLVEYLASFWNSEAVKKIKEDRHLRENPHIDDELQGLINSGDYKENPLIKAIQKIRQNANLGDNNMDNIKSRDIRRVKAPIDLEQLAKSTKI